MAALLRLHAFILLLSVVAAAVKSSEEEFSEELLLRPLPDRKLLSHFHFQTTTPPSLDIGRHHHLFPKAIAQLVKKFQIKELELSFTQGRWNYERWGGSDLISTTAGKPPGVELWALFDVPLEEIDFTWKNLTHALSGLFCASINFLESSTTYFAPSWSFQSDLSNIRYGALPREAVCTENLTPWLKLLPCRDKAGLPSLLDRPSIYKGYYHSQRLRISSSKLIGIVLEQTLSVVLQPNAPRSGVFSSADGSLQPSWSISSIFKKELSEKCSVAKSSKIYIELEKDLVQKLKSLGSGDPLNSSVLELYPVPRREIEELNSFQGTSNSFIYEYVNDNEGESWDLGIRWKVPLLWSSSFAPFHVRRFLMGSGNERGSIAISLQPTEPEQFLQAAHGCSMQVVIFQVVPWYVRVYYHSMKIFVDGKPQIVSNVIEKIKVTPSEDKLSPGMLELMLRYPCNAESVTLTIDFDKGFLHIDDYPPDANQGFDIPSALVTFPDFQSSRDYVEDNTSPESPLLLKLQNRNAVRIYTEVLLVPLTTPDFSMPYNVITFTCTVLALYFGSLLNALRRRMGEEERLLKSQDKAQLGLIPLLMSKIKLKIKGQKPDSHQQELPSSSSKPKQILIVAVLVLAIAWHYFLK